MTRGWRLARWGVGATLLAGAPALAQHSRGPVDRPGEGYTISTNDDLQPTTLPTLPLGMTVDMLVDGDRLFHGRGGCFACHGTEGQGLPAAGDALTTTLFYAQYEWKSIDSLITAGLPDELTRSPIAMPARGARGDLTREETQRIAAYVWAISQVKGEPWPGGHASHQGLVPPGSTEGTAQEKPWTTRGQPLGRPSKSGSASSSPSSKTKPSRHGGPQP
jgi:mono/diheme cytochrome c family protein